MSKRTGLDDWSDRFEARPARTSLRILLAVFGIFVVLSIVGGGWWLVTLPFRAASGVVGKTLEPDNIISNYEWFKQQYEDIGATDIKIVNAQANLDGFRQSAGDRASWSFEDKNYESQLRQQVLGLTNQRQDMVATYNARAKMLNRSIFMAGSPPTAN